MARSLHWRPEGERRQPLFVEWLYFKFFAEHLHGIVVFGSAWGMPGVVAVQLFPEGRPPVCVARHDFPLGQTWRSTTDHRCRVGEATVERCGELYRTSGALDGDGHRTSWDLLFTRRAPPCPGFCARAGALGAGTLVWDVVAPLARAQGRVEIDGEPLAVEGDAYVDTNYGRWLFALDGSTHWNWAWVRDRAGSGAAVVGMNLRAEPEEGRLAAVVGGAVHELPTGPETFEPLAWQTDAATGLRFPSKTRVRALGPTAAVDLVLEARSHFVYRQSIPPAPMRHGLPTPFEWALVECPVQGRGRIDHAGGTLDLEWAGIREYPLTRIHLAR